MGVLRKKIKSRPHFFEVRAMAVPAHDDLIPFSCLVYENICAAAGSKQTARDGTKLVAALDVRSLVFQPRANEFVLSALVHSTHTKRQWYEVNIKGTHEYIGKGGVLVMAGP